MRKSNTKKSMFFPPWNIIEIQFFTGVFTLGMHLYGNHLNFMNYLYLIKDWILYMQHWYSWNSSKQLRVYLDMPRNNAWWFHSQYWYTGFLILVSWLTESRNIDDRHEKIQIKLIHRKKEKSICNLEIFRGKRFSITEFFFLFSILFISTSTCRHMIFKVKYVFQRTIFNSVSDILQTRALL